MDYHHDRFEDFSLLVFKDEKLMAICPANIVQNKVFSHQGLTYGGFLLSENIKFNDVLNAWKGVLQYLYVNGVLELIMKLSPKIYHKLPSDEIDYLLFKSKAILYKRDIISTLKLKTNNYSKSRTEGIKRGEKHQLKVVEEDDLSKFWNHILIPNLKDKYQVNPVHTLEEIQELKNKFKNNIRHFNVYFNNTIVAGTTIFETKRVARAQYISGDESKNQLGSLDFLYDYLLTNVFDQKDYLDLGSSNERNDESIKSGMLTWKEGFGARSITQDFYKIETANYTELNDVIL